MQIQIKFHFLLYPNGGIGNFSEIHIEKSVVIFGSYKFVLIVKSTNNKKRTENMSKIHN